MAGRAGLDVLRDLVAGRVPPPPLASTLDMTLTEVDEGRAIFSVRPQEFHLNPGGVVHGGVALTLVDSAAGCAVLSMLPAGVSYTTLETKVNFVRAITLDTGEVRCEGEVVHLGRSTATAEARVVDAEERLLAHGTSTLIILRG
jgi:uncharacterized protein (TIGR00369 family)